jgi:hypothetical protein
VQRFRLIVVAFGMVVAIGGCASDRAGDRVETPTSEAPVPITSIAAIKGKWAGVVARGSANRDDWLELTINDDGSFQYTSARTIGVLQGRGQLSLRDGQGFSESERARSTYQLIDRGGKRVLRVDVVETNGLRYGADLAR